MTTRIAKLVSLVPSVNTLADGGCDHGYVGIEALKLGRARRVVFVDISQPSLEKARENCPEGLKTQAEFVCRDGLGNVEVDCAVIAGMGGLEIISILEGATALPDKLVLQPMRNQRDVRKYLQSNYELILDEKFFDGKYYDVIVATLSANPSKLTELELEYGKTNLEHPSSDFASYLIKESMKIKNYPIYPDDDKLQAKVELMEKMLAEYFATGKIQ